MRILLAEDDKKLNESLTNQLLAKGFDVDPCYDGEEALYYAEQNIHDVILLDRMLPYMEGSIVVTKLRQQGISIPIILITALGTLNDKVTGLNLGADDYLVKPFAFEELLARIRLVLKKRGGAVSMAGQNKSQLGVGRLSMDVQRYEVSYDGKQVELTHREFELLRVLLENKNIVISRDTLLQKVCGYDYMGETNIIDVYVRYLRSKLDDVYQVKIIQTVRGVGYCIKDEN